MIHLSLIVATSKNGVIGNEMDIPWRTKGEQLIFKALTFSQWCIVGRKTYETVKHLKDRKFAIVSRTMEPKTSVDEEPCVFSSIEDAIAYIGWVSETKSAFVIGGTEIYRQTIGLADTVHISVIDTQCDGDAILPNEFQTEFREFNLIYTQEFVSDINYTYAIYKRHT